MTRTFYAFILLTLAIFQGTQTARAEGEKHQFTLVIDAGHGGHDPGAIGAFSKEKTINLNVALAFGRLVEENCSDVKVIYTRRKDVFIPLQRRADIANSNKADLFISIHTNALPAGRIAYGAETYSLGMARASANLAVAKRENSVITLESDYKRTYEGFDPNKAESYVIFEIMQDRYMKQSVELARYIQRQYKSAGRADKGVHQAGFLVLRNTSMPSVLTELGFISTPQEETYLNSQEGITEMSRSLYNGFLAYRRQHDKGAHALPADLPTQVSDRQPNLTTRPEADEQTATVAPVPTITTEELHEQKRRRRESKTEQAEPAQQTRQPVPAESQTAPVKKAEPKKAEPAKKIEKPEAKKTEPKKKAEPKRPETKKPEPKKAKPAAKPKAPAVKYSIQVGAGKTDIATTDKQFKGLKITREKVGSMYRYYNGTFSTYAAAQKALQTTKTKIPGAYIVAFIGSKSVSLSEARAKEKSRK